MRKINLRKKICLFTMATLLPCMVMAATPKVTAPSDSEMVYRANLGRAEDIALLLKQGGNLKAVDNNGVSLLFLAAGRTDDEGVNVVHTLLSHGIPINTADDYGRTALFFAAKSGNGRTVEYLLNNGIDAYQTDINGDVARNYAYKNGHTHVVELMDNFARKKIEEVNSAYERINQELQKRYNDLAKKQMASATPPPLEEDIYPPLVEPSKAPPAPAQNTVQATTPANIAAPDTTAAEDTAVVVPDTTVPAAGTDNGTAAADIMDDTTLDALLGTQEPKVQKQEDNSPEALAAKKMVERIDARMDELRDQKMLEARIAEEEYLMTESEKELQAKIAEERMQAELSEERAKVKAARKAAEDEARQAEEELRRRLEDANMQVDLKAEIAEEAAIMKHQLEMEEKQNPALLAERVAKEKELQEKRDDYLSKLTYHNCMFQYWYYCYTSGLTTELSAEELRDTIEGNKEKIIEIQDILQKEYGVTYPEIQKVSFGGKMRVFAQLNLMRSSRQRRSEGVGNVDDSEKRCGDIGLHWDVGAGSVVDERFPNQRPINPMPPGGKGGPRRLPPPAAAPAPSGSVITPGTNPNSMVITTQPPASYAPYPTAGGRPAAGARRRAIIQQMLQNQQQMPAGKPVNIY